MPQNPYLVNGKQCSPFFRQSPILITPHFYRKVLISPFYDFSKISTHSPSPISKGGFMLCKMLTCFDGTKYWQTNTLQINITRLEEIFLFKKWTTKKRSKFALDVLTKVFDEFPDAQESNKNLF